jgi:hypothetical protein
MATLVSGTIRALPMAACFALGPQSSLPYLASMYWGIKSDIVIERLGLTKTIYGM